MKSLLKNFMQKNNIFQKTLNVQELRSLTINFVSSF